jgi:hypothetical protein
MIKKGSKILLILVVCGSLFQLENSYGHGLGLDTIKTATINGKKLTVTAQITPTEYSVGSQKKIIISASDSLTNQNVNNITFLISLFHEEKLIFKDYFFTSNGMLGINVKPTMDNEIMIKGEKNAKFDAWHSTESKPIELIGPVFSSGGLYHFEIEIKTIDDPSDIVESSGLYTADVTVVTNHLYEEDMDGNTVKFGVKSYYDKISNFDYESSTSTVRFEMPFDWSEQNISHVPVVHEEIHFPKGFDEFFVPSYVGKVNGIELFKSSITVDDYSSEEERIVHFVLSQDNLRFLKQAQKAVGIENPQDMEFTLEVSNNVVFPVIAMTKNEEIQVDLSWDPISIEPHKNTRFIFTFRNPQTGETLRSTTYDFVILQNGEELFRKSGNAHVGGDYADYTFLEGQTGQTSIRFENLRGMGLSTEFGITVVPEFGPLVFFILSTSLALPLFIANRKFSV